VKRRSTNTVQLPVVADRSLIGTIRDAAGREICVVDANRALSDRQAGRLARYIARAVNQQGKELGR
jgi:hypothetical protein